MEGHQHQLYLREHPYKPQNLLQPQSRTVPFLQQSAQPIKFLQPTPNFSLSDFQGCITIQVQPFPCLEAMAFEEAFTNSPLSWYLVVNGHSSKKRELLLLDMASKQLVIWVHHEVYSQKINVISIELIKNSKVIETKQIFPPHNP